MTVFKDGMEAIRAITTVSGALIQSMVASEGENRVVGVSPVGEFRTTEHIRLVGASFNNTLDSSFWITDTSAGGTASVLANVLTLSTGTSSDAHAGITSVRAARYIAGTPNYFRDIGFLPTLTSGNICRWGAYDSGDGVFYEVNGTNGTNGSSFYAVTRMSTVDTKHIIPSFSYKAGDVHTFEIYMKNTEVLFHIDDDEPQREGAAFDVQVSSTPYTGRMTLPVTLENFNVSGNVNNVSMKLLSASINRLGAPVTKSIYGTMTSNGSQVFKYNAGTLHSMLVGTIGGGGKQPYFVR